MGQARTLVLLALLMVFLVGIGHAFAFSNDSSPLNGTKNYASTAVGKNKVCSNYGFTDSNNDGVCDQWKITSGAHPGLNVTFTDNTQGTTAVTYQYYLPCTPGNTIAQDPTGLSVCPSTSKKDIYLEVDWMTGQGPDPQAITDVVKAFDNMGIALHVQYGEVPSSNSGDITLHYCDVQFALRNTGSGGNACTNTQTPTNIQSYPYLKQNFFGTVAERKGNTVNCPYSAIPTNAGTVTNHNSYNCLTAKRQVFHYAMYVIYQSGNVGSSGWAEVLGNDLVISLGNFTNGVGSIDQQEGTLLHELGHNFGLHHGGVETYSVNDPDNCKPNYLSVMSYTYQFRTTADICRPLAFSNGALATLHEDSLSDSNVGSSTYPSNNPAPPPNTAPGQPSSCPTSGQRPIWWSGPTGSIVGPFNTNQVEDWNQATSPTTYSQVLNNLPTAQCTTTNQLKLVGFNDTDYILHGDSNHTTPLIFRTMTNFWSGNIVSGSDEIGTGDVMVEAAAQIPPPPTVSANANPSSGEPPLTVSLLATASGGSGAYSYSWSFGDGSSSAMQNPSHIYSAGGTYLATVTVTDSSSSKASSSVTINVGGPPIWPWIMAGIIVTVMSIVGVWVGRRR